MHIIGKIVLPAMVRNETGHSYPTQQLLDEETFIVLCDYDQPVPRDSYV